LEGPLEFNFELRVDEEILGAEFLGLME